MSTPSTSTCTDGDQKPATDSVAVLGTYASAAAAAMAVVVVVSSQSSVDEQVLPSTALSQPNHEEEATVDCSRTTNVSNINTNDDDTMEEEILDSSAYRHDTRTGNDNRCYDRNNDAVTTCVNQNQQLHNGLDLRQCRASKPSAVGASCANDSVDKQVNLSMDDEDILDILANSHAYITQQVIHDMKRIVDESTTRPNSNDNANVGAFYMNGPSQRNEQSDDDDDNDNDNDDDEGFLSNDDNESGTSADLPEVSSVETNNSILIVEDSIDPRASLIHVVEATLVDDIVVATAVGASDSTTITAHTTKRRFVPSQNLLLFVIFIGIVCILFGVRINKSSTTPQVNTVVPAPSVEGNTCFQDGSELKEALIEYLLGGDDIKKMYGEIGSWCVHKVKDFSGLFNGNDLDYHGVSEFNENISQWNTSSATSMVRMFGNATKFNGDISGWDVSSVTDMSEMFSDAESFNGDLSMWDVSHVTKMDYMFINTISFNGNISQWNTSSVKSMNGMFYNAISFDRDLLGWDVSSVTDMTEMFSSAVHFNGDLSTWNTSSTTTMMAMFDNATSFNKDISGWDVSNVEFMMNMFSGATSFNGNLSKWDVSSVVDMSFMFSDALSFNGNLSLWNMSNVGFITSMFAGATSFNGNISFWNVSIVDNMISMFSGATSFNGDLSKWDVSGVGSMDFMFAGATSFNGEISKWDVSSVHSMSYMFAGATSFNGNLSLWNVSNVIHMDSMFADATSFNGDLSMWNVSNVFNIQFMFENAVNFNQSLCTWGNQLLSTIKTTAMFVNAESCPSSSDPDLLNDLPGPFCHECL